MTNVDCRFRSRGRQRGVVAVEIAILGVLFFTFVFGVIEVSRALYLWNTMTEVTRRAARAAAVSNFSSGAEKDAVRTYAMFSADSLPLAGGITKDNIQINYLQADGVTPVDPLPASPAQNLINCTTSHRGPTCIRFVQARLCLEGDAEDCTPVPYTSLIGIMDRWLDPSTIRFPSFATVTPVASFGRVPGAAGP